MAESLPLYEGLFLMGQSAGANVSEALDHVRQILDRAKAEVIALHRWDERKLSFPVKGQKRGTYLLSLFRVAGGQIANIERDCNLSDEVLRVLFIRADHMGEVEINLAIEQSKVSDTETNLRQESAPEGEAPADAPEPVESME